MMKRMTAAILAMILMLAMSGAALADDTITVTGSATVQLEPDMVTVMLGVTATEDEVIAAQQKVNEAMAAVVAVLTGEELAIAPEDIATTEYYINEQYEYDYETSRSVMVGYEAAAMLSVCVRDIDRAGLVIDAAMQAGANRLNGVEFMSSDQTAARDQALTLAVQDGMRKAKVIAAAAGVNLPAIPSAITEESAQAYPMTSNALYAYAEATADTAGGTKLQAGLLNLTARVVLVYEID